MKTVVFACVHNAGRSQMAAGFFNALANRSQVRALSAGTRPADAVHPQVLDAMREVGVDLAAARPTLLTRELVAGAERVITMGCGEDCPYVPGVMLEDWPLLDPKGQSIEQVRQIRDEIRGRVEALLAAQGWSAGPRATSEATFEICRAQASDFPAVHDLLREAGLVTEDLDPELRDFFVALREGRVVGAVGLEPHGSVALLRSLVVAPDRAGRGLGRALALQQVEDAEARGFRELFLLTRTASDFFAKLGFARIERDAVPDAIQRTAEYATLCPATATVMVRALGPSWRRH